jgi:hypothetical protein
VTNLSDIPGAKSLFIQHGVAAKLQRLKLQLKQKFLSMDLEDSEMNESCLAAIANRTVCSSDASELFFDTDTISKLLRALQYNNLQTNACRVLCNLIIHVPEAAQAVYEQGGAPALMALPSSTDQWTSDEQTRKWAVGAIGCLMHYNDDAKQDLYKRGVVELVTPHLASNDPVTRMYAAEAIIAITRTIESSRGDVIKCDGLPLLVKMLTSENTRACWDATRAVGIIATSHAETCHEAGVTAGIITVIDGGDPEDARGDARIAASVAVTNLSDILGAKSLFIQHDVAAKLQRLNTAETFAEGFYREQIALAIEKLGAFRGTC